MVKLHKEAGFGHLPLKFELIERIDKLKLPGEKRPDVILRLLELAESVNTKQAPPKVSTPQKGRRKKIAEKRRKGPADA